MGIAESWLSHTVRSAGGSCPTRFRGLSRLRPENRAAMSLRLKELASVYLTDQDSASLANGAHRAVRCLDFEPEAGPSPACRAPRAAGCQCISKLECFSESMICRYTSPPIASVCGRKPSLTSTQGRPAVRPCPKMILECPLDSVGNPSSCSHAPGFGRGGRSGLCSRTFWTSDRCG